MANHGPGPPDNPYRRALEAGEARFRKIIEKNADGVLVVGHDGTICFANPAAEVLLGRRAAQLLGAMFGIPVSPDEITEIELVRGAGPAGVAEMRVVEIDWEGAPAYLASLRDITERKRAEQALRFLADASSLLAGSLDSPTTLTNVARLSVDHLADYCLIDLLESDQVVRRLAVERPDPGRGLRTRQVSGRYAFAPDAPAALARVLRTRRSEVCGSPCADFFRDLEVAPGEADVLRGWGCRSALVVPLLARGRALGAITFLAQSSHRYGPADLALAEDLARRAALALDNARLYDEAQEAVRRRDEFLAMLAHELRNPLAAILSAEQVMELRGGLPPALTAALEVVERQGRHMARLLDDLLDISRVMHGKIQLRREPVDLVAVLADAVQATQPYLETRAHRLSAELPGEPLWLEGDATRLGQVFVNLLHNAAKYTEPGGRVWLTGTREDHHAVVRVRDSGIGIPAAMLPRIFDLFIQVDPSIDRAQGGLGIGLTLVKNLVELHGGTVTADSPGSGRGSEFTVRLPLRVERPAAPEVKKPVARIQGRRVLIVEDSGDSREMLRDLLQLSGYSVEIAEDGLRGVELLQARRPDVALIDIGLPGLDGYQVARAVREAPWGKALFLVAVTGYSQPEDCRRALAAGFDAYLVKPVNLNELCRLLDDPPPPREAP